MDEHEEQALRDNVELLRVTCQGLLEVVDHLHIRHEECQLGCDACTRASHARAVLAAQP